MLKGAVAELLAWEKHHEAPLGLKLDNDEKTGFWMVNILVVAIYGVVHQM
jgi:hypothetical protein